MTSKKWYDDDKDYETDKLKINTTPFGFITNERLEYLLNSIKKDDSCLLFYYDYRGRWLLWRRPKTKGGHWTYHTVIEKGGRWFFKHNATLALPLYKSLSMVGFGGVEYEGCEGTWFMDTALLIDGHGHLPSNTSEGINARPAIPVRVRFWVED